MDWTVVLVSLGEATVNKGKRTRSMKLFLYCHGFNSKGIQQSWETNEVSVGLLMFSVCLQPVVQHHFFLLKYHPGSASFHSVEQKPVLLPLSVCRNEQSLGDGSLVPVTHHPLLNIQERCFVTSLFKGAGHFQSTLLGQDLSRVRICISFESLLCRTVQNRVYLVFWYLRDSLKIAGHLVSLARGRLNLLFTLQSIRV